MPKTKVRSIVQQYAEQMENELSKHDQDRGVEWSEMGVSYLYSRMAEEIGELGDLLYDNQDPAMWTPEFVKRVEAEAADVGNFGAFISEVIRRRFAELQDEKA